jgi:predicted esterase
MHGLGDSADGFADVAEMLSSQLPHVKFILPTAPSSPVTLNGGMVMNSWYDIVGLDDRAAETCEGLDESRNIVNEIVQQEVTLGIPHSRIVLAGFSQVSNSSFLIVVLYFRGRCDVFSHWTSTSC